MILSDESAVLMMLEQRAIPHEHVRQQNPITGDICSWIEVNRDLRSSKLAVCFAFTNEVLQSILPITEEHLKVIGP